MSNTINPISAFQEDIRSAINRASKENGSDTPDFILARYLDRCLDAWNEAVASREQWYGRPCGGGSGIHHAQESKPDPSTPTRL